MSSYGVVKNGKIILFGHLMYRLRVAFNARLYPALSWLKIVRWKHRIRSLVNCSMTSFVKDTVPRVNFNYVNHRLV